MSEIETTNRIALQALAVGRTRAGGSVLDAVGAVLRTPPGGWGESVQACQRLRAAVAETLTRWPTERQLEDAIDSLIDGALAAGWDRHPDYD